MVKWDGAGNVSKHGYICGFCGSQVGPFLWYTSGDGQQYILICPRCEKPTYFDAGNQTPAPLLGNKVESVPKEIDSLYNEARACTGVGAFTATVLTCRKLLMHIAVEKGADEGKRFIEYVEYLSDNHYVSPDAKGWVDHIRTKSNEANHEIVNMEKDDALDLISFIEMLLRLIYEFPERLPKPKENP